MKNLNALLNELESYVPHAKKSDTRVSQGSVGWHVEHCLLSIRKILGFAATTDPQNYKRAYKPTRILVLGMGFIPRGRIKAPKSVTPEKFDDEDLLAESVAATRQIVETLPKLHENQHFPHPALGILNKKPTARFLQVHTAHHLKIIKEIMAAK